MRPKGWVGSQMNSEKRLSQMGNSVYKGPNMKGIEVYFRKLKEKIKNSSLYQLSIPITLGKGVVSFIILCNCYAVVGLGWI